MRRLFDRQESVVGAQLQEWRLRRLVAGFKDPLGSHLADDEPASVWVTEEEMTIQVAEELLTRCGVTYQQPGRYGIGEFSTDGS